MKVLKGFNNVSVILTILVALMTGLICFNYISINSSADLGTALILTFISGGLYLLLEYITIQSWEKPLLRIFLINFHVLFSALVTIAFVSIIFKNDIAEVLRLLRSEGFYYSEGLAGRLAGLEEVLKSNNFAWVFAILYFFLFLGLQAFPIINSASINQKVREVKKASQKSINDLFEQQVNAFSYIQHELGNKLPAVKGEFSYLKRLIAVGSGELNLNTRVRKPLEGEDPASIDIVSDIICRIEDGLNYSINSLQNAGAIISANRQQLQLENVGLLEFLKDSCDKVLPNNKQVEVFFNGDTNVIVKIDKAQFTSVINNIISNAIDHGFKDKNRGNKVVFNVKSKKQKVELIIKNNGAPFPDDFLIEDFLTPYRYSGETGKTGMGGHFVGIILKKHNAEITLLPYEQEEEFKVKFLITFEKA